MNKTQRYEELMIMASALLEGSDDLICRMANLSSLLFHNLERVNWAGFYRLVNEELILGPFQGKPACTPIALGKGVCGSAAASRQLHCIENVHTFPGHIACDASSKSEIVIPLIKKDTLIGVLDLDSDEFASFDEIDITYLSKLMELLLQ